MSTGILFEPSPAIFSWVEWGDDLKSMWEKLQDFDLEFQVKACDVASLSNVQDDPLLEGLVQDATSRYDIMMIYTWNAFVLCFASKKKIFSNRNKGHLGSRYIILHIPCYPSMRSLLLMPASAVYMPLRKKCVFFSNEVFRLVGSWTSACDNQEMAMSLDSKQMPIRGLIHLAAVLDDATLPKLTRRHGERVQVQSLGISTGRSLSWLKWIFSTLKAFEDWNIGNCCCWLCFATRMVEQWSFSFLPVDCTSMKRVVAGFKHAAIAGVSLALVEWIILVWQDCSFVLLDPLDPRAHLLVDDHDVSLVATECIHIFYVNIITFSHRLCS